MSGSAMNFVAFINLPRTLLILHKLYHIFGSPPWGLIHILNSILQTGIDFFLKIRQNLWICSKWHSWCSSPSTQLCPAILRTTRCNSFKLIFPRPFLFLIRSLCCCFVITHNFPPHFLFCTFINAYTQNHRYANILHIKIHTNCHYNTHPIGLKSRNWA